MQLGFEFSKGVDKTITSCPRIVPDVPGRTRPKTKEVVKTEGGKTGRRETRSGLEDKISKFYDSRRRCHGSKYNKRDVSYGVEKDREGSG